MHLHHRKGRPTNVSLSVSPSPGDWTTWASHRRHELRGDGMSREWAAEYTDAELRGRQRIEAELGWYPSIETKLRFELDHEKRLRCTCSDPEISAILERNP